MPFAKHFECEKGQCLCWQDCCYFYQDPWPKCQKGKNLEEVEGETDVLDECEEREEEIPLFSIPEDLRKESSGGGSSRCGELILFKLKDLEEKE